MTRRDKCFLTGRRASLLTQNQAAMAWRHLSGYLQGLEYMDTPKFKHLLKGIRGATIAAKNP